VVGWISRPQPNLPKKNPDFWGRGISSMDERRELAATEKINSHQFCRARSRSTALSLDVGQFLVNQTIAHLEDVHAAHVPFLSPPRIPDIIPAHDAAVPQPKDLFNVDVCLGRSVEETL